MTSADAYRVRTRHSPRGQLLRAALLEKTRSVPAWRAWRSATQLDRLDAEASRLVPLLLHNLPAAELAGDPDADRLRGCARHAWARSQAQLHAFELARDALAAAGIESLLVKGLSLALGAYPDPAVRPTANVDLLFPVGRIAAADTALRAAGWAAALTPSLELITCRHMLELRSPAGQIVRLHWHLLMERPDSALDAAALGSAHEITAGRRRVPVPAPTAQLFHLCARALVSPRAYRLQWAADAWHVLSVMESRVDFALIEQLAVEHRLVVPVREALRFLAGVLDAPIPDQTLRRLGEAAVEPAEERGRRWVCRLEPALTPLPLLWYAWRSLRRGRPPIEPGCGFPRYLCLALGLAQRRDLLPFLARAGWRRLGRH